MSRGFYITTMGCQMNEYDSDLLAQNLICSGFNHVDDPEQADLILINTCTVRAKPEHKAFSLLGRLTALKSRNPGLILGIVGCLAQQFGADIMERFPEVDLVIGPREIGGIQNFIKRVDLLNEKVVATRLDPVPSGIIHCDGYFKRRVTGQISIMQGCNNFCSYCIVPFVRGRETSRPSPEIVEEAGILISEGVKEITLLGQNVNSYSWEGTDKQAFVSLLRELNRLPGLERLRFTTSHPKDLSPQLVECFKELDRLCPHIHLPFQAGSNRILKAMRRGYTREKYIELIDKLRKARPDIAVTSDVMVGFPGESREDFAMTLDLINQVQFDALFSFKYSDRRGTLAEKTGGKVDESEKSSRLCELQELQKQISLEKNQLLEGKEMAILVEGESKRGDQVTGRTGSNKIINCSCNNSYIGQIVNVKVKHGFLNSLQGDLV